MKQPKPLSPAQNRIVTMLHEADGAFVRGALLCAGAGIPMDMLSGWMRQIREARPDLLIESKHGSGYRVAQVGTAESPGSAIATMPGYRGGVGPAVPLHRRMAANMAILDLLPPKTAELVKRAALDSCEDIDATLHRLISYGVEVHNDLVLSGENPVGLRRTTAGSRTDQVWQ